MNKLTRIQFLVVAHFAAKEALEKLFTDDHAAWVADSSYNPKLDAAMQHLCDLLPLLQAAKDWDSESDFYLERYDTTPALAVEVAKLLDEVQP